MFFHILFRCSYFSFKRKAINESNEVKEDFLNAPLCQRMSSHAFLVFYVFQTHVPGLCYAAAGAFFQSHVAFS